jgi:hypothetical protein
MKMILRIILLTVLTLLSLTPIHSHAELNQVQDSNYVPLWMNALKELFGMTDSSGKVKTAKDKLSSVWFEHSFQNEADDAHVVFTKTQTLEDNGDINTCHACGAEIGAVTYKKVNDEWQIISKQQIGDIGSYGDAPEITQAEIFPISPNKFAFLISDGFSQMGYETTGKYVFLFNNGKWQHLGFVQTGESNGASSQCADEHKCLSSEGKVSVITGEKEYPDLLVTKTGTEQDDKGNIIHAKNANYVFNGKEYQITSGDNNGSNLSSADIELNNSVTIKRDTNELMIKQSEPISFSNSSSSSYSSGSSTVHTGKRGGRYTITSGGNKRYLPRH